MHTRRVSGCETELEEAVLDESLRRQVEAERELALDLEHYVGRWVAVRDHRVMESAKTLERLLDIIDADDVDAVFEVTRRVGTAAYY